MSTRLFIAGTTLSAVAALSGCGPNEASSGGGGSTAAGASASTSSASGDSGAGSAPSTSETTSSTTTSSATSSSTTSSGSSAQDETSNTVTGTHSKARIAVPKGWKVFTGNDLKNPAKLSEISAAAGVPASDFKKATIDDRLDDLLIGPHLSGGGAQNITMGTTKIPNSEGIPDEPVARMKAAQQGVDFVKFSYANTSAGRGAAVETKSTDSGTKPLTQIDFYVLGSTGKLVEVLISTADSASANSLLQGVEKSISVK